MTNDNGYPEEWNQYLRLYDDIQSFLKRHGFTPEDAEDATQELYFLVAEGKTVGKNDGYLFGTAFGIARDAQRKASRRGDRSYADSLSGAQPDPYVQAMTRTQIIDGLSRLSQKDRTAFVMVELEGLSQAAVAAALGVSEATISRRMERATNLLKEHLS